MNEHELLSPDDPRLTAYALGEMTPAEQAAFERLLAQDPAARAAVEEIRTMAAGLDAALQTEAAAPAPSLTPVRRETVATRPLPMPRREGRKILTFPGLYYLGAGLAAACFALVYVAGERSRADARRSGVAQIVVHARDDAATPGLPGPASMERRAVREAAAPRSEGIALVAAETQVPDRFFAVAEAATSVFPLRVGKESYAQVRERLRSGARPPREIVQVAELINAFAYTWPAVAEGEAFAALLEETAAPWAVEHRLVRVGLKGVGPAAVEIARAAQVRVEFNPARVRAWRLIGFEGDGQSLGVAGGPRGETMRGGETVTALYEIVPATGVAPEGDPALLHLSLDYVDPATGQTRRVARRLESRGGGFAQAGADMKFVAAVAAFGLSLRDTPLPDTVNLAQMADWAEAGSGADPQRREFVELMRAAAGRWQ